MTIDPMREVFSSRWKFNHVPALKEQRRLLETMLDIREAVRTQHGTFLSDQNLSALGRADAARKYIATEVAPQLYYAQQAINAMRAQMKAQLKSLGIKKPDPADVAAASLRADARAMLRSMSHAARVKLLLSPAVDPLYLQAVLEGPNELSGLNDELREQVTTHAIESSHPGTLAKYEEADEAVAVIEAAYRVATDTARAAAEFADNLIFVDFVKASLGDRAARIESQVATEFKNFSIDAAAAA